MRWPWQRRLAEVAESEASADVDEARAAREQAEAELQRTRANTTEVAELAARLRQHRRVNHFAELFARTMGGRANDQ